MIVIETITIETKKGLLTETVYNIYDFPYDEVCSTTKIIDDYINNPVAFDIEATTITRTNSSDEQDHIGFMYAWQLCFGDKVVFGRRWEEFTEFLDLIQHKLSLTPQRRLPIYVHYLAYEFQFVRNFITVESVFARKKRVPLKVEFNYGFEFRCSYFLSNMSLDKFIKNTPNAIYMKMSGEAYDYRKVRTPSTELTNDEQGYRYCDVRGLCEALTYLLQSDTNKSIPMTSTGFLRREVRQAVLKNPQNYADIQRCALTPIQYNLCKAASRGGNTHANADYSNVLLENMKSKDRKSSYPAEMLVDKYPVTPFRPYRTTKENLFEISDTKACLILITVYEISMKFTTVMPYLPIAKCIKVSKNRLVDNGRIVEADFVTFACTDVDFKIILNQYDYRDIEVQDLWAAEYGRLNNEFRYKLLEYFEEKTKLENGDPYLYMKFKNKINAFFGMMLTDICNPQIEYVNSSDEPWSETPTSLEEVLSKHYKNRRTFLSYQHGIWVTANARKRLQDAIDIVGHDTIYTDTDSVKYLGDHEADFKEVNDLWLVDCENNDIPSYVTVNGKRTYLGTWEDDGEYSKFKTLGAKKYAYIPVGSDEIHITVAGLNKIKGAKYIAEHGGMDAFAVGTVVPKSSSGRTSAHYNDTTKIYQLTVNGDTFTTSSNIAVVDTEYTFGLSDEYAEYLNIISTTEEQGEF